MRILAIETSCDETAIAIAEFTPTPERGQISYARSLSATGPRLVWGFSGIKTKPAVKVLSHLISSQVKLHAKFGGVVPNLAKREHQKNLVPLFLAALREAKMLESKVTVQSSKLESKIQNKLLTTNHKLQTILEREPELMVQFKKHIVPLAPPTIDAVAVTYGPGLEPALWVGVNFARALALTWKKPIIPVNHMAGHIYSFLAKYTDKKRSHLSCKLSEVRFPALALLVSGGHTQLVLMAGHGKYKLLGETRDDAAGEAFDKVARMLGFGYPGGPFISKLAERGDPHAINFPRPMINAKNYDFSFSGLKTAVLYYLRNYRAKEVHPMSPALTSKRISERLGQHGRKLLYKIHDREKNTTNNAIRIGIEKMHIAASFEEAVVDVLVKKTIRAAKEFKVKTIILGGGVAANKKLRHDLGEAIKREIPNTKYLIPDTSMTGDNALMIALAAYFNGKKTPWQSVHATANARLGH